MQSVRSLLGEEVESLAEVLPQTEVQHSIRMAKYQAEVMLTRTPFDPEDLPFERLLPLLLQTIGGEVRERPCDEVLVFQSGSQMDAHFDAAMHAR